MGFLETQTDFFMLDVSKGGIAFCSAMVSHQTGTGEVYIFIVKQVHSREPPVYRAK